MGACHCAAAPATAAASAREGCRRAAALLPVPAACKAHLTAHCRGRACPPACLQVWGHVDGKLQPLLQIGERTAPALRAVVCEPLGALITAHNGAPRLSRPAAAPALVLAGSRLEAAACARQGCPAHPRPLHPNPTVVFCRRPAAAAGAAARAQPRRPERHLQEGHRV